MDKTTKFRDLSTPTIEEIRNSAGGSANQLPASTNTTDGSRPNTPYYYLAPNASRDLPLQVTLSFTILNFPRNY